MITIAVAGLLLAVAIPSFRTMTVNSRLTSQVNDLVSALNLARSEAITRNGTISLCRVDTAAATACTTSTGVTWANWIVRTSGGTVIRRGTFENYGSTIIVRSTLTNETVTFTSDGLARTNGGALLTNQQLTVCGTKLSTNNVKTVALGQGSRISVKTDPGTCT